ncbi:MAG: hypothetical protein CME72_11510 [Halomonadaceae bacterium]|nr:hypothetical protein [Halomonadaceae bacterium]
MKLYQSHKRVHATPMTLGGFARYAKVSAEDRMAKPPHGDPNAEGYLVIYNRGTEDHYESWSPKHVFDDGYTEVA